MLENAALFVGYKQIQRTIRDLFSTPEQRAAYAQITDEDDLPALTIPQLFLSGAISGTFASLILTPVELIKCKLQIQLGSAFTAPITTTSLSYTHPIHYRGPLHVILHTLRIHGPAGFYRGHLATAVREMGGGAAWFGVYELACRQLTRRRQARMPHRVVTKRDLPTSQLMLAGALGGISYNFFLFPVDVVKSCMQTDEETQARARAGRPVGASTVERRGFVQVARDIYNGAGVKGFYRGCGITVARSAPASAIIFATY
ncbi:mitochondrial carrier domain-containing protein, partial [Jimgerdemannia flammicorona]